jgi:hypothetical protein
MRQLDESGDTDIPEEEPTDASEVPAPVISSAPLGIKKRRSPADKWDAMDILGRLDVLEDMEQRGMLPRGVLLRDRYVEWEALDLRFGNLLYDIQEKVESYFRKNFEDLD